MRVLRIGGVTLGVSAAHEADWPALADAAKRSLTEGRKAVPSVWFRTDSGAVGSIPLSDWAPVVFEDTGDLGHFVGVVTQLGAEADMDGDLHAGGRMRFMDIEGMPEDERLAKLASIEKVRPGMSSLAAGTLAGPATPDRPNLPVWEYKTAVSTRDDVHLEDLLNVRFPVIYYGGTDFTITSVAEDLRTDPTPPRTALTVDSVLDLWSRLYEAGVIRWDSDRRAVEHIRPRDDYNAVLDDWGRALRDLSDRSDQDNQ